MRRSRHIFLSLSLACAFALAGCASSTDISLPALPAWQQPADPRPISGLEVKVEAAIAMPGVPVFASDNTYTLINHAWFERFLDWEWEVALRLKPDNGRPLYTPESFDCEDFAVGFAWAIARAAGKANIHAAPLVARVVVLLTPSVGPPARHEMIGVCTDKGIYIVEPQPDAGPFRVKSLDEFDRRSILSVVFGDYNP